MALNIKNDEDRRLARELAEATGTTLTAAVTKALQERLDAARGRSGADLLLAEVAEVQRFLADLPDRDTRSPEEMLGYDRSGLPG